LIKPKPKRLLNNRWYPLRYHSKQAEMSRSDARFIVNASGRRSGKTELVKRLAIQRAMDFIKFDDGRFIFGAPTIPQARQIYWNDLKRFTNIPGLRLKAPNESRLEITLFNGARLQVHGLDKPERVEGDPIDGIVLDEYGNMKPSVWDEHVRPGLDTPDREGWAMFIGTPEGRNHYYKIYRRATTDTTGRWQSFHWPSWEILTEEAIEEARRDLDEMTFRQEYGGEFVNFGGRAYYCFDPDIHATRRLPYDPEKPIALCFDFNVSPGIAVICQEHPTYDSRGNQLEWCKGIPNLDPAGVTCVIGEVWIDRNSNTPKVCKVFTKNWKNKHRSEVHCFGDATGGARHTSQTEGTDWDLIWEYLKPEFPGRLHLYNKRSNPPERVRVNSVNSRLQTADGFVHCLVDPYEAPHLMEDLDTVTCDEAGELDKKTDKRLTHPSDAFGYYIEAEFSIAASELQSTEY